MEAVGNTEALIDEAREEAMVRAMSALTGLNEAQTDLAIDWRRQMKQEIEDLFAKMAEDAPKAALRQWVAELRTSVAEVSLTGATTVQMIEVLELIVKHLKDTQEQLALFRQLAHAPKAVAA